MERRRTPEPAWPPAEETPYSSAEPSRIPCTSTRPPQESWTANQTDAFIVRYSADGFFQWARALGGDGYDGAHAVAADEAGRVLAVGSFSSEVDFDPGPKEDLRDSNGLYDGFALLLDGDGNFLWVHAFGGAGDEDPVAVAPSDAGGWWVAGGFEGTSDFAPGRTPAVTPAATGGMDAFLLELNADGHYLHHWTAGGPYTDFAQAVAPAGDGAVYVAGSFHGSVDFGAGDRELVASNGGSDVFIARVTDGPALDWVYAVGGAGDDSALGLCVDADGDPVAAGYFTGSVDFDPGPAAAIQWSAGGLDAFVTTVSMRPTDCFGPTLVDFSLIEDTGRWDPDLRTRDLTPVVRLGFSELVTAGAGDFELSTPDGSVLYPDEVLGAESATLLLLFLNPLPGDGSYRLTIPGDGTLTDLAGNPFNDGGGGERSFDIDTTPDSASILPVLTEDRSPEIRGRLSLWRFQRVEVRIDDNWYEARNPGMGDWRLAAGAITPDLDDGVYDVTVRVTDEAGNLWEHEFVGAVIVDTAPPLITSFSVADPLGLAAGYTMGREVTVNIVGADAAGGIAGWLITETPEAPDPESPDWRRTRPETWTLSDGPGVKHLYAWAQDLLGHVSPAGGAAGARIQYDPGINFHIDVTNSAVPRLTFGQWIAATDGFDHNLDEDAPPRRPPPRASHTWSESRTTTA